MGNSLNKLIDITLLSRFKEKCDGVYAPQSAIDEVSEVVAAAVTNLNDRMEAATDDANATGKTSSTALTDLNARLDHAYDAIRTNAATIAQDQETTAAIIAVLDQQLTEVNSLASSLDSSVSAMKQKVNAIPTITGNVTSLTERVDDNASDITGIQSQLSMLRESVGGLRRIIIPLHPEVFNDHEYVDLGLPSGTLWAKCNVGAESESDYGLYFQWGDTEGYTSDTKDGKFFDLANYKWCEGTQTTQTKYNTEESYGTVDNLTELELADDAARQNMGGHWRMPNKAQINELLDNTTAVWTTVGGKNGRRFTSKTNGNSIFIPAAGYRAGSSLSLQGSYCCLWSRSLLASRPSRAWGLYFNSDYQNPNYDYGRCYGFSVRGVL